MKTVSAFRIRLALLLSLVAMGAPVLAQDNTRNYVLTRTHKNNGQSPDAQYSVDQVHMALTYFDGLGRPQQALSVQTAPDKKDLVSPTEYDELGRVKRAWLPAPTGNQNASFQGDATTKAETYYNNASRFDDPSTQANTQTDYEPNLLNRVSQTRAPATGNTVRRSYGVNGTDEVKRYDAGGGLTDISSPGNYPAKTLTVTTTKDEQDYELSEFTDRDGQVVLRRAGKNGQYARTYYVYDDLSQLRAVLQPQFQSNADLNKYAFLYRYDGQGRVVEKRVPGSNNVSMEYDGRDRLVASTDGRGQKFYYHYDELNRQTEMGLCNGCNPTGDGNGKQFLVRTQYDKYDNLPGFEADELAGSSYFTHDNQVRGQVTGQWVRILQDNGNLGGELQSVNFYDSKYRLIQTRRQLTLGSNGWERISYQRDFLGKVLKERTTQSWSGQSQSWEKTYTYDHADRLTSTTTRVSGGGLPERSITLSVLSYNEVGQLTGRKLHAADVFGTGNKASLGYKYNVRGWLRGITNSPQSFGLSLNYQQNGNVSYMGWQHPASGGNYSFEYDDLNRLKKGRRDGNSGLGEELTYDANGNILTLKRFNGGGGMIDDLSYTYDEGNRLTKVTDGTGNGEGFNNGTSGNNNDYSYDGAGNLTSDANRGANLSYNVLNLPRQISLNGKTLKYTYDGTGSKRNLSVEGSGVVTTYEGAFEYDGGGTLQRIATDEGQLVRSGGNWAWQYYLKDHLGNVRIVLDENGNAIQQTEYQPFGLAVPTQPSGSIAQSAGVNKYLYNGKEWQPETGYLDYGARQYDAAIGRWFNIDRSAEKYESISPFTYSFDNPIRFFDIKGNDPGDVIVLFAGANLNPFAKDPYGVTTQIKQGLTGKLNGAQTQNFLSNYAEGRETGDPNMPFALVQDLNALTQEAYDYIKSNLQKDGRLILYGYSWGGVLATHLSKRLAREGVNISSLILVDAANGPFSDEADRTIPSNVANATNIYQENAERPVFSRGYSAKKSSERTEGVNVRVKYVKDKSGKMVKASHNNIDDATLESVVEQIIKQINKNEKKD